MLQANGSASVKMASARDTFGFEILYKLHQNDIQKKEDVIILLVHWYLVKCGLRCIDTGDSNVFDPSEKGSETLPTGWNTGPSYTLRYLKNGTLYLFSGIKSDDEILINLAKLDNDSISNMALPIKTVSALHGSLETLIPSHDSILHRLQNELIKPICKFTIIDSGNTTEATTQTTATSESSSSRRNPMQDFERIWQQQLPPRPYNVDPGRVGAADLYPGAEGGGMLFDPFSPQPRLCPSDGLGGLGVPGRLPPGARPPGARFDPFGPPDLDPPRPHRRRPDDDHLPPPGFDDMFM